ALQTFRLFAREDPVEHEQRLVERKDASAYERPSFGVFAPDESRSEQMIADVYEDRRGFLAKDRRRGGAVLAVDHDDPRIAPLGQRDPDDVLLPERQGHGRVKPIPFALDEPKNRDQVVEPLYA